MGIEAYEISFSQFQKIIRIDHLGLVGATMMISVTLGVLCQSGA